MSVVHVGSDSRVPGRGLEPLYSGPKPDVLPLNDPGETTYTVANPFVENDENPASVATRYGITG